MRRVTIKDGWDGEGRTGKRVGPDIFVRQNWTPVLWDGEEDPSLHKSAGLTEDVCHLCNDYGHVLGTTKKCRACRSHKKAVK